MFDSPTKNGFTFTPTRNIEQFVTSYIFRFFPPELNSNILNTVELATYSIYQIRVTFRLARSSAKKSKQVDGPTEVLDQGFLLGCHLSWG